MASVLQDDVGLNTTLYPPVLYPNDPIPRQSYDWMSIKAGSESLFTADVRFKGNVYDKNNNLISGGGIPPSLAQALFNTPTHAQYVIVQVANPTINGEVVFLNNLDIPVLDFVSITKMRITPKTSQGVDNVDVNFWVSGTKLLIRKILNTNQISDGYATLVINGSSTVQPNYIEFPVNPLSSFLQPSTQFFTGDPIMVGVNPVNLLNELADVNISVPTAPNTLLKFDGVEWSAQKEDISNLNDVNLTLPLNDNNGLIYNTVSTKWENKNVVLVDGNTLNNDLTLGTLDNFNVKIKTNNIDKITIENGLDTSIILESGSYAGISTRNAIDANDSTGLFIRTGDTVDGNVRELTLQGGSSSNLGNAGNVEIFGGDANGSGQGGDIILQPGTSTTLGQEGTIKLYNNSTNFLELKNSGLISTNVSNYESLVLADNDIPNKKFVDDQIASIALDNLTDVTLSAPISTGQILGFNGSVWTNTTIPSNISSTVFPYKLHTTDQVPPPATARIIYNTVDQTLATRLYINHINEDGQDIDVLLKLVPVNSKLIIQDKNLSDNYQTYSVVSKTDHVGYVEYEVFLDDAGGTGLTGFANNQDSLLILVNANSTQNLTDLNDVSIVPLLNNGQGLVYNGLTAKWENKNVILQNGNTYASDVVVGSGDNYNLQFISNNTTKLTIDKQADPLVWLEGNSGTAKISTRDQIDNPTSGLVISTGTAFDQPIGDLVIQSGSTVDGVAGKIVIQGGNSISGSVVGNVSDIEIKAGVNQDPLNLNPDGSIILVTGGVNTLEVKPSGLISTNVSNYETLVLADDDIPNKKYVDDAIAGTVNNLDDLADVTITAPLSDNSGLVYDTITTQWIDKDVVLQNGNSYGALMSVGTNDANNLEVKTNGFKRATFFSAVSQASNNIRLHGTTTNQIIVDSATGAVGAAFNLQAGDSDQQAGNLSLRGGTNLINSLAGDVRLQTFGNTNTLTYDRFGVLSTNNPSYETLVTANNIFPNRKWVLDQFGTIDEFELVKTQPLEKVVNKTTYFDTVANKVYGWTSPALDFPAPRTLPTFTGTTYSVTSEASFITATFSAVAGDIIDITTGFTSNSTLTISQAIKITSSTSATLTFNSTVATCFNVTAASGSVLFEGFTIITPSTSSVATSVNLTNTAVDPYFKSMNFFTNEFAITSLATRIQVVDSTFSFSGTADSHRYIAFYKCTGLSIVSNCVFNSNGSATPNTIPIFFGVVTGSDFINGKIAVSNCNSNSTAVQRLAICENSFVGTNFEIFLANNNFTTSSGYFIIYNANAMDGISRIVAYDNIEVSAPTSTGSKGLISLDFVSGLTAITYFPILQFYNNTVPALRTAPEVWLDATAQGDRGVAYNTLRFSVATPELYSPLLIKNWVVALKDLSDVSDSLSPINGQVLAFDSSTGQWNAINIPAGVTDLANLNDVALTLPIGTNQLLRYNGSKWANSNEIIETASNVNIAGVGVYKQKTGNNFEFRGINAGSSKITVTDDSANNEIDIDLGTVTLDDLSNVVLTAPITDGQVLRFNATNWVNSNETVETASNVNVAGVGVFKQKTGNNFEFRGINSGSSKITVTNDSANNEIDIDLGSLTLDDLSNVIVPTPTNGNLLVYNGTNWVNSNLIDSTTTFVDNTDPTKQFQFQASTILTGTTRTLTVPNADGTLALTSTSWQTAGNNISAAGFIGSTTAQPVTVITNNQSRVRFESASNTMTALSAFVLTCAATFNLTVQAGGQAIGGTGNLLLAAGDAAGSQTGGNVTLRGGSTSIGTSGNVTINTGNAGTTSGSISMFTGNSNTNTSGISIVTGNSLASLSNPGPILTGGISIITGNLPDTIGTGSVGNITIQTGSVTGGNKDGGSVFIRSSLNTGTGIAGAIYLQNAQNLNGLVLTSNGLLSVDNTINYHTLVTTDNAIPNRRYITDGTYNSYTSAQAVNWTTPVFTKSAAVIDTYYTVNSTLTQIINFPLGWTAGAGIVTNSALSGTWTARVTVSINHGASAINRILGAAIQLNGSNVVASESRAYCSNSGPLEQTLTAYVSITNLTTIGASVAYHSGLTTDLNVSRVKFDVELINRTA